MAKENPPKGGLPSGGYAPISAKRVWMSMRVLRSPSRGLRVLLSRSHDGSPPAGVKFLQVWTADSAACTALSASSKSCFSISDSFLEGVGYTHPPCNFLFATGIFPAGDLHRRMYKGGFRIISEAGRQVVWLEFFGPYFAIWQGFGWLDESQVDWQETV
jgi:hypothetical protein